MNARKPPVAVYVTADGPAPTAYGVALMRVVALPSARPEWAKFQDASEGVEIDWRDGVDELREHGLVKHAACDITPAGLALLAELGVEVVT